MDLKRNIDEIIAIYDLEESVKDIYVEGKSDKTFFQWLIGAGIETESEVYSVDDIFVSEELLEKYGLSGGSNRNKVIAVSIAISEALPDKNNSIFIVDRDYSEYIGIDVDSHLLRFTDYNSLELYSLREDVIRKLMALVYGQYSSTLPSFYDDMEQILKVLYAIRLTNIKLGWNMSWLDFNKYVQVSQVINFKEEKYIEAYLQKNSKWSKRNKFNNTLTEVKQSLKSDCRLSSRGHDFTELLMHILNKKSPARKIHNKDVFEGFLLGLLDKADMVTEKLMGEIYEFSR